MSNKITAIIPTFNEEKHIAEAIKSVLFADEIIVIDSFSTDRTIEIAEQFDVIILKRVFDDFSSQKNYAIEKATHNWVFILDADERVSKDLKSEILKTVTKISKPIAYYIFRTYDFMGKRMKYSGFQSDKVIRLFKKEFCRYDGKLVHEEIKANGEIGFLKSKLEHFSYNGLDHYINKLNNYAGLQAKMLSMQGVKPSIFHFLIKPIFRFIKHYILKFGFLDGIRGFIISVLFAYGVFMRYVNLWLIQNVDTSVKHTKDKNVKIDVVYTWVDGNDDVHIEKMKSFLSGKNNWGNKNFKTRFRQVNEIEYSIKSIIKYAPFVKDIYIVTDNQTPGFLEEYNKTKKEEYPNIIIVDHKTVFDNQLDVLPVFNSMSIETKLHRIPNLSEHFVYFNDDFMLLNKTNPQDFFIDGEPVIRGKWTKYDDKIIYKIIHNKLLNLLGRPTKDTKYGYKRGQQNAARVLNFNNKYLRINHTPTPIRKSKLTEFFKENPKIEFFNAKFRFRSHLQFLIQSMANNIEVSEGTGVVKTKFQLFFVSSFKKTLFWYKQKLKLASNNPNTIFLCVQSLDKAPQKTLEYILNWLENRVSIKK